MGFNISKEKTMKYLMKELDKLYEKPSTSNNIFLMKCLFNIKMLGGRFVADHLNEFNTISNQLSFVGVNFDDEGSLRRVDPNLEGSWNDGIVGRKDT
jgi:hypothetical protein